MNDKLMFYNISETNMSFETVISRITEFMKSDPHSLYVLSIGTDSHIHKKITRFITAIHLHRVGKGAWGCLKNYNLSRPVRSLREKISLETSLSQEIAYDFTTKYVTELSEVILPYIDKGADFRLEVHLDIGKKGMTKELIHEMTGRITAMGIEAKIKPDSYAAFSYANRYTK
ncbi:ribonuclease H-like YkuK family protein [Cytobacillus sp. Hm23]